MLLWGKYKYLHLLIELSGSLDIFQDHMNNLVGDLEFMHTQLDDLLYLIHDSFKDHIDKLEIILKYLKSTDLKCNTSKSVF